MEAARGGGEEGGGEVCVRRRGCDAAGENATEEPRRHYILCVCSSYGVETYHACCALDDRHG
eukprot:1322928-Pyramimonas_sp.AAC.1